jgi:hypothetical protein
MPGAIPYARSHHMSGSTRVVLNDAVFRAAIPETAAKLDSVGQNANRAEAAADRAEQAANNAGGSGPVDPAAIITAGKEQIRQIVREYLVELGLIQDGGTPGVTLPALTITPATGVAADAPAGTLLGTVNVATPSGATRALILGGPGAIMDPNDATGRRIIRSSSGTVTAGTLNLSVRDTHPNATNSPQTASAGVTIAAAGGGTPTITKPTFNPASGTFPLDAAASLKLADILPATPAAGITRTASGTLTTDNGKAQVLRGLTSATEGQSLTLTVRDALTSNPAIYEETTFTATAQQAYVPPAGAFEYTALAKPTVGSEAGVTYVPQMQVRSAAGELQGFAFNAGSSALAARYGCFALTLERGLLLPTEYVEYVREDNGTVVPAQMAVLRKWPDGSAKHVRLACMHPALTAGQTIRAMLRKASVAPSGAVVTHAGLSSSPFTGSIQVKGHYAANSNTLVAMSGTYDIGVSTIVANATAGSYWMQGPICTERRYILDMPEALRLIVDIRVYADGSHEVDYQPAADKQRWANAGGWCSWQLGITIAQGGTNVLNLPTQRIGIAQVGRKLVASALSAATNALNDPPVHNVQVDAPLYTQMGVFPIYNYGLGVKGTMAADVAARMTGYSGWRSMLNNNGVRKDMGAVAARMDIGIVPGWHAEWCMTQAEPCRRSMIATGEVAGATKINAWDITSNTRLNIFSDKGGYPGMWFDYRGNDDGSNPSNITTPDSWDGWEYDTGHTPMLPYLPYVATGDRFFYDRFEALVMATLLYTYPPGRRAYIEGGLDWCVMQNNQPREAGWNARDLGYGAMMLPDVSPFQARILEVVDYTFQVLLDRSAAWAAAQGQCKGWLPNTNPYDSSVLKHWMQDHVAAGTAICFQGGSLKAAAFMDWARNYMVGRFMQDANGMSHKKACWFLAAIGNSHDILATPPTVTTWAQMDAASHTDSDAAPVNGFDGGGNYNQLGLRTLAYYAMLRGDDQARAMIDTYVSEGARFTDPSSYRADPTDNMRPLTITGQVGGEEPEEPEEPGEPVAAVVIPAGQTITNPANAPLNTVLGRVVMTGGTPVSVTISDPRFAIELDGDVLLKQTISDTSVDRTFKANVTATNSAGAATTQEVTFAFTAVAAGGGAGPGYPALPVTYHARLAMRRTKTDYASSIVTLETTVAPIVSQAFGLNSSGVIDRAAVTSWLSSRAANARGTYATWHNQDAPGTPFAAPSAGFRPRFTKDDGSFYYMTGGPQDVPCIRILGGTQGLKALLSGMPAGGKKIGAVIAFQQVGANAQFHRVLAFTGTGQANDYDNPASIALIDQNDGGEYQTETNSENVNLFTGGAGVAAAVAVVVDATLSARAMRHKVNDDVIMGTEGGFAPGMALPSSGTLRIGFFDDAGTVAGPELLVSEVAFFSFDALTDVQIETLQAAVYSHTILP